MTTGKFKSFQRSARQIDVTENYNKGMRYVNAPTGMGECKLLVNYNLKDAGISLEPRAGLRELTRVGLGDQEYPMDIHHTSTTLMFNPATNTDVPKRYTMLAAQDGGDNCFDFTHGVTVIEDLLELDEENNHSSFRVVAHDDPEDPRPDKYYIKTKARVQPERIHDIAVSGAGVFTGQPTRYPWAQLEGFTIVPVQHVVNPGLQTEYTENGFAKLTLELNAHNTPSQGISFVTPKVITPTMAVNYGYNMLDAEPYAFSDVASAAIPSGHLRLEGVLPYADSACTTLKFNARVGEWITFRAYAQFPDTTSTYKFKWELNDLNSDKTVIYENQAYTTNVYQFDGSKAINTIDNSDYIRLTVQPPFKQFGVTITAYNPADLTEPIQVITLGSYTLAADGEGSSYNMQPLVYPVYEASDFCAWKQRLVVWGVPNAPNLIFFSDINDPSYFPYPNNSHMFTEEVVACLPHLNNLLVFTTSQIHKITLGDDGLSFKTELVQHNLSLTPFDKETIMSVQSMIYFKSNNYYYMMVPKTGTTVPDAIQLAPISNQITFLLDHFKQEVVDALSKMYNPDDTTKYTTRGPTREWSIRLQDYHVHLENNIIKNVYNFDLILQDKATKAYSSTLLSFDFVLNYDVVLRAWTTHIYQTDNARLFLYKATITDYPVLFKMYNGPTQAYLCFLKSNRLNVSDNIPYANTGVVLSKLFKNYQLLDTGAVDQRNEIKKRYRRLMFTIVSASRQVLEFATAFILDNTIRKDMFEYELKHEVDLDNPGYGWLYIAPVYSQLAATSGDTTLDDADNARYLEFPTTIDTKSETIMLQSSRWALDISQLAPIVSTRVALNISGKGYAPRFILLSFNEELYELQNHIWVYRSMNAR